MLLFINKSIITYHCIMTSVNGNLPRNIFCFNKLGRHLSSVHFYKLVKFLKTCQEQFISRQTNIYMVWPVTLTLSLSLSLALTLSLSLSLTCQSPNGLLSPSFWLAGWSILAWTLKCSVMSLTKKSTKGSKWL